MKCQHPPPQRISSELHVRDKHINISEGHLNAENNELIRSKGKQYATILSIYISYESLLKQK